MRNYEVFRTTETSEQKHSELISLIIMCHQANDIRGIVYLSAHNDIKFKFQPSFNLKSKTFEESSSHSSKYFNNS